jgi:glycosyltransferase involved in cell wall biosynthesis
MQITFVSSWYPVPTDNGAKMRVMMLLKALARDHTVDFIGVLGDDITICDARPLEDICRSVVLFQNRKPTHVYRFYASLRPIPYSQISTYEPDITSALRSRVAAGKCDIVICGELTAYYGLTIARQVPVIVDELDPSRYVDLVNSASAIHRSRAMLTFVQYRRFIVSLLRQCAGGFVASEEEAKLLRNLSRSGRVAVVPNAIALEPQVSTGARDSRRLVYSGAISYEPNRDAVTYFATDILPLIRRQVSDAWLTVTGKADTRAIEGLSQLSGLTFTGWLPDIRAFIATSRACVVPLRRGGGTRLKILEAMAVGTPVVTTTKGAEGLAVTNGDDILIADTPEAFAEATIQLLTDDALHARIAAGARATIAARYDEKSIGDEVCTALLQLTHI